MAKVVDARGLSCPEPILLTKEAMNEVGSGSFEVLVDNQTQCFNVIRICKSSGWNAQVTPEGSDFRITVSK
ncbi:MAG: sulfurtransferase TusA family protein [Firmicutes bacterium]|nr:sulfurtransferase TusA family protein [Bacillota bacterium]